MIMVNMTTEIMVAKINNKPECRKAFFFFNKKIVKEISKIDLKIEIYYI